MSQDLPIGSTQAGLAQLEDDPRPTAGGEQQSELKHSADRDRGRDGGRGDGAPLAENQQGGEHGEVEKRRRERGFV